jgi:hypothetical protein
MTRTLETTKDWWPPDSGETLYDFYVQVPSDDTFHIGQSYSKKAAPTIACKHCGGLEFNVGSGEYYTAIRCVKCKWEALLHNG